MTVARPPRPPSPYSAIIFGPGRCRCCPAVDSSPADAFDFPTGASSRVGWRDWLPSTRRGVLIPPQPHPSSDACDGYVTGFVVCTGACSVRTCVDRRVPRADLINRIEFRAEKTLLWGDGAGPTAALRIASINAASDQDAALPCSPSVSRDFEWTPPPLVAARGPLVAPIIRRRSIGKGFRAEYSARLSDDTQPPAIGACRRCR